MNPEERFNYLRERGARICQALGLKSNLVDHLESEPSDWAYIIKVDALLEMASRALVANTLRIVIAGSPTGGPRMDKFVAKLPTTGRSSLRDLLEIAGCPPDRMRFLDAIRQIRNAYAHDITCYDETMLSMILKEKNAEQLLGAISSVEPTGYDFRKHLSIAAKSPGIIRFGIMHGLLQYLGMSYRQWGDGEVPG
jgi:hypothetical protein